MSTINVEYDTAAPVLVTGATGYVAGWLIKRLLEEGFTVHAAVRDPSKQEKVAHLTAMANDKPGKFKLFKADLLDDGSYLQAMQGCQTVFHTASPFITKINDPQRDLVDPALNGTRNVLTSVNAVVSVKRVVLTSSCAAIFGAMEDIAKAPGGILTEAIWNTTSSLVDKPYNYSKTLAERAAWDMMAAQQRWQLVVINPALVVGPSTSAAPTSASFDFMKMLGDGTYKKGVPSFELGMVDVRDVAEAHMRAAFIPTAEGRHITFAEVLDFNDLADYLREAFGNDLPLPSHVDRSGKVRGWKADNSKSKRALGIEYHSVRKAVTNMFQQLLDTGAVASK